MELQDKGLLEVGRTLHILCPLVVAVLHKQVMPLVLMLQIKLEMEALDYK